MAKRLSTAGPKLPFLKDREFEEEASLLLAEYGAKYGTVDTPPVPIDEIVELHLGLRLEFYNMEQLFGVDDVHGALWVNEKRVGINQRLDPTTTPAMLGRYRFTLAHEAGHWRLHRNLFQRTANQLSLLPENVERPEYVCRSSDTQPIEYQANRFASCILMPRQMLLTAWETSQGTLEPMYIDDLRRNEHDIIAAEVMRRGSMKTSDHPTEDMLLEYAARPLAEQFEVSAEAMRIRLEGLKLQRRTRERSLF